MHYIRDIEQAKKYIFNSIEKMTIEYMELCFPVIHNDKFWKWPGSLTHHHNFEGGLAVHTAQVMSISKKISEDFNLIRENELALAGLWHDYGKIFDYEIDKCNQKYKKTNHLKMIYHLPRSYAEFFSVSSSLPENERDFISHLILSHHGRLEHRSPVEPQVIEAYILHQADIISSVEENNY